MANGKSEGENTGAVYGYCRVSTDKQDTERQVAELLEYCKANGLGDPMIIRETVSGAGEKPELERILGKIGPGDTLAVWELSRLTRGGVAALFNIADRVRKAGGRLVETKSGTVIDETVAGEAYVFALGLAARIEREMIAARTKSALKARKEAGVKLGRPEGKSKLDEKREEIARYQKLGINKSVIAKLVGCSRSTYLRWLKRQGEEIRKRKGAK
jgi:DNA invertase Pin-like site-specific DNA recombinase